MGDIAVENIKGTRLFQYLKKKADEKAGDTDFPSAVEALCKEAESYTTQIVRFFPTFTRHDYTHSDGVCEWMARLLDSMTDAEGKPTAWDTLTAEEAALLLLAAYWHDTGMAVTDAEKKELLDGMDAREGDWAEYFKQHPEDVVALGEAEDKNAERERILRLFVRERHAARCTVQLYAKREANANHVHELSKHGINYEHIAYVCESHGKWLHELNPPKSRNALDLRLCVVLLRLADQLDYDESRAPESLYHLLNLGLPETDEQKKSREEWEKNMTGGFGEIVNGKIEYSATFTDSEAEHGVQQYLKNLRDDLSESQDYLSQSEKDRWRNYRLPYDVDSDNIERDGYDAGDFHITMDQDRVLKLLTGENLYDDAGVFVRELVQNSIDAVLARRELDKNFGADMGKIDIYSWQDGDYDWFRIEDDGVGMNKDVIQKHFLRVGHSYYESDEYKNAIGEKSGEFRPISRFGIGILSCFMTDGDNTRLSLSTRHYDETQPLRMDVNRLHGYYNLAALKPHEREGKPLPAPNYWAEKDRNKTEVGRDVGTTICVRVNRLKLGYASFRELLDKYVVFPEVRITYFDERTQAGYTYPTQHELMDLVHAAKTNVFPFPGELLERVKRENPSWEWKKRPTITLKFRPLDTPTEGISGVVVNLGCQGDAVYGKSVKDAKGRARKPRLKFSLTIQNDVTRRMRLEVKPDFCTGNYKTEEELCKRAGLSFFGSTFAEITFDDLLPLVTDDAARETLRLALDAVRGSGATHTVTAFHGAAADRTDLLDIGNNSLTVLLLSGEHRPTVSLARNEITALPFDTLCALTLHLGKRDAFYAYNLVDSTPFAPGRFALLPETAWRDVLDRHRDWEHLLTLGGKSLDEWEAAARASGGEVAVKYGFTLGSIYNHLLLAALNRRFSIHWKGEKNYTLVLREKAAEPSALPIALCVEPSDADSTLGVTWFMGSMKVYSHTHPFFRWLLREHENLERDVPAVYRGILKTMMLGGDKDTICHWLNDALERLSRFPGDPFHAKSVSSLTEKDCKR